MGKSKPNIVVIMADQLAPHFTGAYGHAIAKTPNIDALATRGMRFDAAYCNPPSDANSQYVRNHMDWTVAATRYRYPSFNIEEEKS